MKMETCNNCKQKVSYYKEESGVNICCDNCYPLTEIDLRAEELFLDITKQYPKQKNIYFKHKFKKHKITFDI